MVSLQWDGSRADAFLAQHGLELDLAAAHEMFGLNYIIFRPHNVYGPNQNIWDRSSAALQPCTHNHARAHARTRTATAWARTHTAHARTVETLTRVHTRCTCDCPRLQ